MTKAMRVAGIFLMAASLTGLHLQAEEPETKVSEQPMREFRGVKVATVANIDWPSKRTLTSEEQKAELIAILNKAVELNLNAIIFQVRPACDALYNSPYEPWSEFLTGQLGKAPEPYYDPLEFIIQEAHRRGLALHAWFNPYRALHPSVRSPLPGNHIGRTHPELVRTYGEYLWLDPGEEEVLNHSIRVILDVVSRYDVDGVYIDDYFYPYKVRDNEGKIVEFPDEVSWEKYQAAGGTLSRDDWRRDNVNRFIERYYKEVKAAKRHVLVGICPFGIWRSGYPPGITAGLDVYADLYADTRRWLNEGWLDYFMPQLYWKSDAEGKAYDQLLHWWVEQNTHGRHIWAGNFTSKVAQDWPAEEIIHQIALTREEPGAGGNGHFSMRVLMSNAGGICEALKKVYSEPALIPESPWLREESAIQGSSQNR